MMTKRVLVDQAKITRVRIDDQVDTPLVPGQVRLHLESFALTANNVTYAATGFQIGYWRFFPSGVEGQGIVPVWGVARAVESRSDTVEPGTRFYGFWPMAETVVIEPRRLPDGQILDAAPHRADLPAVYNRYTPVRPAPQSEEHLRALLQPLLATSYLLFDWLEDNAWFGAQQIIVGSASSKTGLGLLKFLAEPEARSYRIIGLTSTGNRSFVEGLGACDRVVDYDAVETLDPVPSVYVDMAGNAAIKRRLHEHLGENVVQSVAVGLSHWDQFAEPRPMPGAKPRFFFAPAQIQKRRDEWGPGVIETRITAAWKRLVATAGDWLEVRAHQGLPSAAETYGTLSRGESRPWEGHVIELSGG